MADEKHAQIIPYSNGACDGHEERLLRHDEQISELNERTAKHDVIISGLPSQIENVKEWLGEKIDSAVGAMASDQAELTKQHRTLAEAVATHQPIVEELIEKKAAIKERRDLWRKAAWTIASGAIAILVKELVVWIFKIGH